MTTADNMTVTATATEYTVSAVPETNRDHHLFAITVAYRGNELWAVCRHGMCLGANGEWDWDWEPIQPRREDDWRAAHRFDLDTALGLARREAPNVTVNGFTVADVPARGQR